MAFCKKCKTAIKWRKAGKFWIPIDFDGEPHFATCGSKRMTREQAEVLENVFNSNYKWDYLDDPALSFIITRNITIGREYRRVRKQMPVDSLPPWDYPDDLGADHMKSIMLEA